MIEDYTGSDPEDWGSIYAEDATRVEIAKLRKENGELRARLVAAMNMIPLNRNKQILDAIQRRTEHLLSLPTEDLKEYLERNYDY